VLYESQHLLVFRMRKFRPSGYESSVKLEQTSSKGINLLFASNKANRKGIKLVKHLVLSSGKNFANNSSLNVVVMKNSRIARFKEMTKARGAELGARNGISAAKPPACSIYGHI
jgi:NOL1/NOP2/fmu family ribosome biogenesis protein